MERVYSVQELSKAEWSTAYINNLPDSAFAYIEPGGSKDEEGKTKPRSLRHFPIRDANGKLDEAHVRNALSRLSQSPHGPKAKPKVLAAARQLGIKVDDSKSDSVGLTDGEQYLLDGTEPEETKGGDEEMSEANLQEEVDALTAEVRDLYADPAHVKSLLGEITELYG